MYFVFDMDETLAELYSVYYFIASLKLQETLEESSARNKMSIPPSLKQQLHRAYHYFVRKVLTEEASDRPLGVLRPGILDVMMELSMLQREGVIKNVIIYSNNSHLQSLEFIRDLIHEYVGTNNLIMDCIHWNHPMRREEKIIHPNFSNKTWSVLKRIMVTGHCRALQSLHPSQVHFFDDLEHLDLKRELQQNYHMVPAYRFRASFDRLEVIYRDVLKMGNVDVEALLDFVIHLFADKEDVILINMDDPVHSIVELFRGKTTKTADPNNTPPLWDMGVNMMMTVAKSMRPKNEYVEVLSGNSLSTNKRGRDAEGNEDLFRQNIKRKMVRTEGGGKDKRGTRRRSRSRSRRGVRNDRKRVRGRTTQRNRVRERLD
jgi:hypothetical protein